MANGLTAPDFAVDVGESPYVAVEASVISEDAALLGHEAENKAPDGKSSDATFQKETSVLLDDAQAAATLSSVRHVPWYAWPLLLASLVAVSSAAVVFATLPDVPTFTLAAWRLSFTTLLLTPAAVYQYKKLAKGSINGLPYSRRLSYLHILV